MKIVIAGAGAVGTHLSKLLSRDHQDCVLIDDFSNNIKDFIDNKGHAVKVSRNFTDMIYEEAKHEFNHFINPSMSADDITGYLLGFLQYEDTINYFE